MLSIDHVTLAASDLDALRAELAALGLSTTYGGAHSNGVTHMAARGFADGSYLELISRLPDARRSASTGGFWPLAIENDAGPCAWSVTGEDVAAEASRVAARGVPVSGPVRHERRRPDGVLVRWEMSFLGDGEPGSLLPFVIEDLTPREQRVPSPPEPVRGFPTGIDLVVLAVPDLDQAVELFRRVYDLEAPRSGVSARLGARLAHFPGQPFCLAVPSDPGDPGGPGGPEAALAARLAHHGPGPCAFVLKAGEPTACEGLFPLHPAEAWPGRQVAWFDHPGTSCCLALSAGA